VVHPSLVLPQPTQWALAVVQLLASEVQVTELQVMELQAMALQAMALQVLELMVQVTLASV
jgi:hypothetical protein